MFISNHQSAKAPLMTSFADFIFYAYANLQMLIMALNTGREKFDRTCYMLRAKAFKAYKSGKWNIHNLYVNNVWKIKSGDYCWYCRKQIPKEKLTIEHIFPRSKEGTDDMDNIVLVCQNCNSSKRDLDLLEWFFTIKNCWPAPYVFAYYLKHVYLYAVKNDLLDKTSEEIDSLNLPFKYKYIPLYYPDTYVKHYSHANNCEASSDNIAAYT